MLNISVDFLDRWFTKTEKAETKEAKPKAPKTKKTEE